MDRVSAQPARRGRGLPLSVVILRYFAYVLVATLVLALGVYVAFSLFINMGGVYPANYGDTALEETSARLAALPADDAEAIDAAVPSSYRWAAFTAQGDYVAGDAPEGKRDDLHAAAFDGLAIDYGKLGMTRFEPVTLADGSVCVLVYEYMPQFVSKGLRDTLPNPQNLFLGIFAVLALVVLVAIAVRAARVISRKMAPLAQAAHRIEERDLDFEMGTSRVREIDDVLQAMDSMRASLKESLDAQWRSEQAQRDQIAALTHDLKTPLTVVRGNVDLLLEGELADDQCACMTDAAEGVRQMGEYIEKLVDASRSGAVSFAPAETDVQAWACGLRRRIEALATSAGVHMAWVEGELPTSVLFDGSLVERAVTNVVANALDFAPVDSAVEVAVRTEEPSAVTLPGALVFEVADEGPGFTPETRSRGCEPFFQADQARAARGHSGLGLYVAAEAATRHGGSVVLSNRVEGGALVTLRFPLA